MYVLTVAVLFAGVLPTEIGNLSKLTRLDFVSSALFGPIPTEIGNLVALERLGLGRNLFCGLIPTVIGNLVNLTSLDLAGNYLDRACAENLSYALECHVELDTYLLQMKSPPKSVS